MSYELPNLPFQSMCVAIERARRVAGAGDGPWTVGIRAHDGELLASATLASYAQVRAFARAMEDLGFSDALFEAREHERCCDFTFQLASGGAIRTADLLHA